MDALGEFIYRQIAKQAADSTAAGKAKYRAYFVDTRLYAGRREAVDAALKDAGYGKVVVKEETSR